MNQPQSWEKWTDEHGPQLVLFARRWTVDHLAAEDLVQEAFVRFWQNRNKVRDPLTYLYQCVRNIAIDTSRSRLARDRRQESVARSLQVPCFEQVLEDNERQRMIETALAELPVEQAEVVTLKLWSALTFAQIAKIVGIAPGTAASRYRYALSHLRQVLSESEAK